MVLDDVLIAKLARPVFMAAVSPVAYLALAYWIPSHLGASMYLKPLADVSRHYAGIGALSVLGYAAIAGLIVWLAHWRWVAGDTPACPRCGEMMEIRQGRRGRFWGCTRYPACRGTEDC